MKSVVYEGYTIKSFPQQHLKSGQWKISLDIFWEAHGVTTVKCFTAETHYATEEDADLNGSTYGQDIIDGKVPGLSVD
ncbi:CV_2116 domain-containing protein [Nitrospira japonica]|nr:hypothetical protein [Nitrospira japonica]